MRQWVQHTAQFVLLDLDLITGLSWPRPHYRAFLTSTSLPGFPDLDLIAGLSWHWPHYRTFLTSTSLRAFLTSTSLLGSFLTSTSLPVLPDLDLIAGISCPQPYYRTFLDLITGLSYLDIITGLSWPRPHYQAFLTSTSLPGFPDLDLIIGLFWPRQHYRAFFFDLNLITGLSWPRPHYQAFLTSTLLPGFPDLDLERGLRTHRSFLTWTLRSERSIISSFSIVSSILPEVTVLTCPSWPRPWEPRGHTWSRSPVTHENRTRERSVLPAPWKIYLFSIADLRSGQCCGSGDHISASSETIFWVKILKFFDADPESFWPWVRDPGWKNSDPGQTSRIRNTYKRTCLVEKKVFMSCVQNDEQFSKLELTIIFTKRFTKIELETFYKYRYLLENLNMLQKLGKK